MPLLKRQITSRSIAPSRNNQGLDGNAVLREIGGGAANLPRFNIVFQRLIDGQVTPNGASVLILFVVSIASSEHHTNRISKGENLITIGVITIIRVTQAPMLVGSINVLPKKPRAALTAAVVADSPAALNLVPVGLMPRSKFLPCVAGLKAYASMLTCHRVLSVGFRKFPAWTGLYASRRQ